MRLRKGDSKIFFGIEFVIIDIKYGWKIRKKRICKLNVGGNKNITCFVLLVVRLCEVVYIIMWICYFYE